jgi:hypothetical protein
LSEQQKFTVRLVFRLRHSSHPALIGCLGPPASFDRGIHLWEIDGNPTVGKTQAEDLRCSGKTFEVAL